jgi:membrane protein
MARDAPTSGLLRWPRVGFICVTARLVTEQSRLLWHCNGVSGHVRCTVSGVFRGLRKPPIPIVELIRRTYKEVIEDDCLGMAARLAYFFALPALIFLVAVVSYLPWSVLGALVDAIDAVAPTEIVALVRAQIDELARGNNQGLLTIGVLGAVWTSSSAIVAIVSTLNRAYDVTESRPWWKVRLISIGLTVGLAVFIVTAAILMIAGPQITSLFESQFGLGSAIAWMWKILQFPLIFALASLGVAIIYYFAPDVDQEWVWITPGSIVACLAWLVVSLGFRYYVASFGNYNETYGALGAAAILLLWMYLTGLAILIGGELNSEIEHASPAGKAPGEKSTGRRRLRAFARSQEEPVHAAPQPSGAS